MDDPIFQQKYQKYKLRVKLWENDFKKRYRRVPSKYDIREASQEVRYSYKMYYKMKTSLLEDTLNDVLSEDGFDVFEMSQTQDGIAQLNESLNESINGGPQLPLDISTIVDAQNESHSSVQQSFSNFNEMPSSTAHTNLMNRDENHIIKSFEAVEQLPLNQNAWGANVSKRPDVKDSTKSSAINTQKQKNALTLNSKLFTGVSFAKRNPRKPLSRKPSNAALGSNTAKLTPLGASTEELPDFETILIRKAMEYKASNLIATNPLLAADRGKEITPKTQIDKGWLQRNSDLDSLKSNVTPHASVRKQEGNNNTATPERKVNYGLSNINVAKFVTPKLDVGHVKLEAVPTPVKDIVSVAPVAIEVSAPSPKYVSTKKAKQRNESDSDSVVADSEEEQESQEVRHIVKRRRVVPGSSTSDIYDHVTESKIDPVEVISNAIINDPMQSDMSGRDFSVNEEEQNATYEPEVPKKTRKKAVAKRTKTIKSESIEKKPAKPRTSKAKDKKPRAVKAKPEPKATRPKRKAKQTAPTEIEPEVEEQPLNPDEFKYVLALESGDITSIPRYKMSELEQADNMAQQYINSYGSTSLRQGPLPMGQVDEKRAAARKKLEEKIASGKLNENFVTINIEKKKFSRGKRTVNYSKFKKQQWKHKKRIAALSGPDMNMGGCDGGVLTCFSCGGVGHFAQNCKIKGDSLLPLTAQLEEDPSPFPTLEEAERMASQSALAVHSRNISKLPQVANAAIYRSEVNAEQLHPMDQGKTEDKKLSTVEVGRESDSDTEIEDGMIPNSYAGGEDDNEDADDVEDEYEFNESDYAELDAAVKAVAEPQKSPIKKYVGHKIPEEFLKKAGLDSASSATSSQFSGVGSLYDLNPDGSVKDVTPEVLEALHMFGHTSFRKGQDRAIMRILSGLSTLVTLSTGSGKSLCYQLPAYLYSRQKKSITLVISPLVSLMEDQVTGVPHFLRAHCLHTNQTPKQRLKILQLIADGEIDILLVSPEAVVSGERSTGFGAILRQLPKIAFACIDEAHCVSQWSHNFRPSYLMICKVLKKNLGVQTVLGLTATATLPTRVSIINHLGISDGENGIISDIPLPDNLILSVSKDENRDAALLQLLNSARFEGCQSIIIYCTRRDECERISGFLRTCMQDRKNDHFTANDEKQKKRKRINWRAESYHAGLAASRRLTIQNAFMNNELRIVVATIAFGMGINKPDIRAVIHYNMPRNFESYVQEVGRAGRDGKISHCHLFLDSKGGDQNELRRHIYANSIDRHVIRKLLQRIFVPCSCETPSKGVTQPEGTSDADNQLNVDASDFGEIAPPRVHGCPGHEIGFSVEKTVEALDIPAENISTLLCYMELDPRWCMNVLSSAYIMAKVMSYGGPKYLKHAAKECPPLAMAIALQIKNNTFKEDTNIIEFSVVDIAAAIGWNSGVVKYQLKNLEWVQINGYPKRSPITVTFNELGFRLQAPGDFTTEEIDDALDTLYKRSVKQEHTQLIQLQYVFQGLSAVAYNSYGPCTKADFPTDRSEQLKGIIRNYFRNDYPKDLKLEIQNSGEPDDYIVNDIHALINMYPENSFSGRTVARIFHGIQSPNYPAIIWGRCKFWRAHCKSDFNRIVKLANAEIVKRRIS